MAAGADLLWSFSGFAGAGAEILPGSLPYPAECLRHGRVRPDSGPAVADRHGSGGRLAGDGDDFRLRELRFATGYRREQGEAQLVGQDGLQLVEDEGGRFDRGHFLDSSAAGIHGRSQLRNGPPHVVRDHPHDLRGLGVRNGLLGQTDQARLIQEASRPPVRTGGRFAFWA